MTDKEKEIAQQEFQKEIDNLITASTLTFHRKWYIDDRSEYAREWLMKNDAKWFEQNKHLRSYNDVLNLNLS